MDIIIGTLLGALLGLFLVGCLVKFALHQVKSVFKFLFK